MGFTFQGGLYELFKFATAHFYKNMQDVSLSVHTTFTKDQYGVMVQVLLQTKYHPSSRTCYSLTFYNITSTALLNGGGAKTFLCEHRNGILIHIDYLNDSESTLNPRSLNLNMQQTLSEALTLLKIKTETQTCVS